MPRLALDLVFAHIPQTRDPFDDRHAWYVLVEIGSGTLAGDVRSGLENELAQAMERGEVLNAAIAANDAQREMFWRLRETIPEAQRRDGASIKHDISIPTSELPRFIAEGSAAILAITPHARLVTYGHLGDGNLHFNAQQPLNGDAAQFMAAAPRIERTIHDLVASYRGSFSAEHGIGQLKRDELERYKNPVALELMHTIKKALDPNGIMNPGKVVVGK
jgi:FAD/FMN-containing dehydrogenase